MNSIKKRTASFLLVLPLLVAGNRAQGMDELKKYGKDVMKVAFGAAAVGIGSYFIKGNSASGKELKELKASGKELKELKEKVIVSAGVTQ